MLEKHSNLQKPTIVGIGGSCWHTLGWSHIVDGRNPANQLRLVVYPVFYKVLDIPGGYPDFFQYLHFHIVYFQNWSSLTSR